MHWNAFMYSFRGRIFNLLKENGKCTSAFFGVGNCWAMDRNSWFQRYAGKHAFFFIQDHRLFRATPPPPPSRLLGGRGWISQRQPRQMPWLLQPLQWCPLNLASSDGIIMLYPFHLLPWCPPLSMSDFIYHQQRSLLEKTVQYSSQSRWHTKPAPFLSFSRRCNLSNASKYIVCCDDPLEFLNLPWCPSIVIGIAVVPSWTKGLPRQELQCPLTNEIRPRGGGGVQSAPYPLTSSAYKRRVINRVWRISSLLGVGGGGTIETSCRL